jgi:hypothetical protein
MKTTWFYLDCHTLSAIVQLAEQNVTSGVISSLLPGELLMSIHFSTVIGEVLPGA